MGEGWHHVAELVGRACGALATVCYARNGHEGWIPHGWSAAGDVIDWPPLDHDTLEEILRRRVLPSGPVSSARHPAAVEGVETGAYLALHRSPETPVVVWLGVSDRLDAGRLEALARLVELFACRPCDFYSFFERHPAAFLAVDSTDLIEHCNRFFDRLGYQQSALMGEPVTKLISESEWARLRAAAGGQSRRLRAAVLQSDGGLVPMELMVTPEPDPENAADGGATRLLIVGWDLRSERQLGHFQRLEAVDRMVSGVAHELNNPLQTVVGNAEMLAGMKLTESAHRRAQRVLSGARRCREVVDGLLKLKRKRRDMAGKVEMERLVRGVARRVEGEFPEQRVSLKLRIQDPVPVIEGRPAELEQAVENVVRNAFQAVSREPAAEIAIELETSGSAIRIVIADNGVGMEPDVRDRAFEPFFTTRGVGAGKGLGLSIALGIVEEHGGDIEIQPGAEGTRVVLSLPSK
jgi:signal transduction histidine kinase